MKQLISILNKIGVSILICIVVNINTFAQTIFFVDSTKGNDANSGTSWSGSFRNLTKALDAANKSASSEVDIWVAHGTYKPIDGITATLADKADTAFAFYRGNGVGKSLKVYGGFAGTETSVAVRDTNHPSFLDGNIGTGINSYHIVVIAGLAKTADSVVVDGFTIRNAITNPGTFKTYNGQSIDAGLGGGVNITNDSSAALSITNCKLASNNAVWFGSGIFIQNAKPLLNKCNFISNIGAAATLKYASPVINNCNFISNKSFFSAGAMYLLSSSPSITNCNFISNQVSIFSGLSYGGAIYTDSSAPSIKKCKFIANASYGDGTIYAGAIYNNHSIGIIIDSCSFESNSASANTSGLSYGGAVYNDHCSATITNSTFKSNSCQSWSDDYDGGGIACAGAVYNYFSSVTFGYCIFQANTAFGYGTGGSTVLSGYSYGGAIYNNNTSSSIQNCAFNSDSAYGYRSPTSFGSYGYGYGGSIYNFTSSSIVNACTFSSEIASGDDYGYGGAIYNTTTSPVNVYNCTFNNTKAKTAGGSIYHSDNNLRVNNCVFEGGISKSGAAIALIYLGGYTANFTSYNSIFYNNKSTAGGSAILFDMGGGLDTLVNNVFAKNKDSGSVGGGVLDITRGAHYVTNNTFYADTTLGGAHGGAIRFEDVTGTLLSANNIFYKNYGPGTSSDTSISPVGTYNFNHNTYSNTDPLFVSVVNLIGADSIWATADDGLELQNCSPARNKGNNNYMTPGDNFDIIGSSRLKSDSIDIGAYETNPIGRITGTYNLCVGYSATLSDTSAGGTWLSKNLGIATITSSGIVHGVAAGSDTIQYIVNGSCGKDTSTTILKVDLPSDAGTIFGPTGVCIGSSILLNDTLSGGSWSATNGNASLVDGLVTGISSGQDTIVYTNSCGLASTSAIITVNAPPLVAAIIGKDTVCLGDTIHLNDTTLLGIWSVTGANATISSMGVVSGLTVGKDTIVYTVTNSCGPKKSTKLVTIVDCHSFISNINAENGTKIEVYPNPNSGYFVFKLLSKADEEVIVTISDVAGQKIKQFTTRTNISTDIRIKPQAGIYFLSAQNKTTRCNAKIMVE